MKIEAKERRRSNLPFLEVLFWDQYFKKEFEGFLKNICRRVIPTFGGKSVHSFFLRPYELDDFISPVLKNQINLPNV